MWPVLPERAALLVVGALLVGVMTTFRLVQGSGAPECCLDEPPPCLRNGGSLGFDVAVGQGHAPSLG